MHTQGQKIRRRPGNIYRIVTADIKNLNVDTLSLGTGLSNKQLLIFCKRQYDRTPKQVLDEYRLFKCIVIFTCGKMSVLDTAIVVGYNTPEALTRAMKSRYGMSPSALQKMIRKMTEDEKDDLISELYCSVSLFKDLKAVRD